MTLNPDCQFPTPAKPIADMSDEELEAYARKLEEQANKSYIDALNKVMFFGMKMREAQQCEATS